MKNSTTVLVAATVLVVLGADARADETSVAVARPAPTYAVGARVGGYGFRGTPDAGERSDWDACRMGGIGVFVTRTLARHFFVEAGVDAYFTDERRGGAVDPDEAWTLDRVSALGSFAGGVRFFPDARVSPHVQLGAGLELTRVTVLEGPALSDSFALPFGFLGLGGDLRLGRVRLGATLRVAAMGFFDQGPGDAELAPRADVAVQGQFYALVAL